jgi:DNA-nicking Smr family endonuclease
MKESDIKLWESFVSNIQPIKVSKVQNFTDKRKTTRKKHFPSVLDLHNFTIQDAYSAFNDFMRRHYDLMSRNVLIITGKSGVIKSEFSTWASENKYVRSFEQKNGGGAYTIKIAKKETDR